MASLLWLKFYPKDWNGDHNLRACSLAARGLLAAFLEPMHMAEPYGHLLIRGKKPDYSELAVLASCKVREVKYGIEELIHTGVLSMTDAGILYSRRMVRDQERARKRAENGRLGGHPLLTAQRVSETEVNQPLKAIEARDQKPEARSQTGGAVAPSASPVPLRTPARSETRTPALVTQSAHRTHAICGLVCLPSALFDEFCRRARHQPDPSAYVTAFVRSWEARYTTGDRKAQEIGGDAFDWWRQRWRETHPDPAVTATGPSAAEILARRRAQG